MTARAGDGAPSAAADDAGIAEVAEVVVIGDGPAGSALAAALVGRGVGTLLVGDDGEWNATYGTWADDLEATTWFDTDGIWSTRLDSIAVDVGGRRTVERPYGVIDNAVLRARLRDGVRHRAMRVDRVVVEALVVERLGGGVLGGAAVDDPGRGGRTAGGRVVVVGRETPGGDGEDGEQDGGVIRLRAGMVVDATGFPGWFSRRASGDTGPDLDSVARQTAFGVVLERPPEGPLGSPTLMDFGDPGVDGSDSGHGSIGPSFAYALPVEKGWLVEETVLAARPAVHPDRLLPRLAARLGTTSADLLDRAVEVERVDIPMGGPLPDRTSLVPAFGAAASMIHPATGYSITSSLTAADRVAAAVAAHRSEPLEVAAPHVWDTIWSPASRRTRSLHDYGLDVLVDLDADAVRRFFATFFDLDAGDWAAYLRIDTPPARLAGVMARMFRRAPWRLRARLVSGDPRAFAPILRPRP